ncbi:MAG: hypothetical protein Q9175_004947 [Cornicularia normoerica]
MDFPHEILGLALSLLQKGDLKTARHVSKTWEKAAVPYLFNEVCMSLNSEDLDTAEVVIDEFGSYVKILTFSAVYYKAMSWTRFKQEVKRHVPQSLKKVLPIHLRYAHDNYCKLRSDQMELLERGTCLAYLCRALRRLPNLQKIVLQDLGSEPSNSTDNFYCDGISKRLGSCTLRPECQLSQSEHLGFLVRPQSGILHAIASPWNLAMLALWAVGTPIRELAVESRADLPLSSFVNAMEMPVELNLVFQNLTKLRLNLFINAAPGHSYDTFCFKGGWVSKSLSGAKSLQCLYIRANIGDNLDKFKPMTPFQTILGTCQFPKLRSLILNSFESTMEELLTFLGASQQLQQLTLIQHELLSGTWEEAADRMQSFLTLEEVSLDYVYGGWGPDSAVVEFHEGVYDDYFGRVQAFFSRRGPNPFSEEMLAAQDEDLRKGREALSVDRTAAAEERYQRYH